MPIERKLENHQKAAAMQTGAWTEKPKKTAQDIRLAKEADVALARRNRDNMLKLASMDPADGRVPVDFEKDHLRILPQGHPARNAEGATQQDEHGIAKSYHEKRWKALDFDGNHGSAASAAHQEACLAHEKAAKTQDPKDSHAARMASAKANGLEYAQTGDIGGATSDY